MNLDKAIIDKLDQIRISKPSGSVDISNPTSFRLLGKGHQGAVFQIDKQRCVKIYNRNVDLARELHALKLGEKDGICPKVYFAGDNFIVMEYLTAPPLFEYLQKKPLDKKITARIIDLLDTFEKIGYNRFDHSARHIYVVPNGKLKIIDVVHMIKPQPVNLAKKLISDMGNQAEAFVQLVKEVSPKWYNRWKSDPSFADFMIKLKMENNGQSS